MGACSTLEITRTKAIQYIMSNLLQNSDEVLGDVMDELLRERCYNVRIVPDHVEDNDDNVLKG